MLRVLRMPARFLLFPFRIAAGSARVGYYAGRAVGVSRSVFFGLGFAAGVLVASPKARTATRAGVGRVAMAVARSRQGDEEVAASTTSPVVPPVSPDGPVFPTD